MAWNKEKQIQYKRIIETLNNTKLSKKETLTALKEAIKNRREELSEWIESGGEDATDNEMLEHNFLIDLENGLNTLEINTQNDKELLTELGKRIKAGKIKGNSFDYGCCYGYTNLYTGKTQGTYSFWKPEFKVDLHDGEIKENEIDDKADKSNQDEHEKPTK